MFITNIQHTLKTENTTTCFFCCLWPSTGSIDTKRRKQRYYTALLYVGGKVCSDSTLLKHVCTVFLYLQSDQKVSVHIPNVFCNAHLQIFICGGIVIH
jgi:hypothetical protein